MSIHIRLLNIAIAINSGYLYEQSIRTKAPAALAAAERHYPSPHAKSTYPNRMVDITQWSKGH